jgi:glycosyltransferase involved in cell wall biosynthesis
MRVVALLATYNEERFIAGCLEHLIEQGVQIHLIDNSSSDATVAIAERYLGRGLLGIETLPRRGMFSLRAQLERKEQLAGSLDADWFIHLDADEIRLPPRSDRSLAQALAEVDADGFTAVNFLEFTFVPTKEAPDHDHPEYQRTMRSYYPFLPRFPLHLKAWKRQEDPVELAWSGGHRVRFPGLRMSPEAFRMRHYLFLSVPHAVRKFVERRYDPVEIQGGWHGPRAALTAAKIKLPSRAELRTYVSDAQLDHSSPWRRHFFAEPTVATRGGR